MQIVKKLGAQVDFGRDQFKVGQGEWVIMTFNEKHHWVFPLTPTSFSYTKLNGRFGKLQKSEMEVLKMCGDFGANLAAREVIRTNKQWALSKMENQKSIISHIGDTIQNTPLRAVNAIS